MESGPGCLFVKRITGKNSWRPSWSGSGSVVAFFGCFGPNDNNNQWNFRFFVGDVAPEVVGSSEGRLWMEDEILFRLGLVSSP